jgi:hypothetical protein
MRGEPSRHPLGTPDPAGKEQERNAEPERVRDEEHCARAQVLVQQEREDRPEVRTHAWREADAEGHADESATRKPRGPSLETQVELSSEERYADQADHLHPEDDQKQAAHALKPVDHLAGKRADERDGYPEEGEHRREPENEGDRVRHGARAMLP